MRADKQNMHFLFYFLFLYIYIFRWLPSSFYITAKDKARGTGVQHTQRWVQNTDSWEHRVLRGLVSCWMWMFEEQKPWKRGGPVCQTFCALKRIKSIENWMRANYSRGRSDVLLGDGWVGAWGFKLITPGTDLKCKRTDIMYSSRCVPILHVATPCKWNHSLQLWANFNIKTMSFFSFFLFFFEQLNFKQTGYFIPWEGNHCLRV